MRLVATLFLAALTVAPTALRAEEASWTRSRRAAIVRSSLPGGVTLVVGSEPGAPVSAVCRIEATTRCDVLPSERLESALRSPASAFGAEEPGAHDRALSRGAPRVGAPEPRFRFRGGGSRRPRPRAVAARASRARRRGLASGGGAPCAHPRRRHGPAGRGGGGAGREGVR